MALKQFEISPNMGDMRRRVGTIESLTLHVTAGNNDVIDFAGFAGGSVYVPPGVANLTWYGCRTADGTFEIIVDAGTAGVQTITTDRWNKIPDACFAFPYLRAVPDATPTDDVKGQVVAKS